MITCRPLGCLSWIIGGCHLHSHCWSGSVFRGFPPGTLILAAGWLGSPGRESPVAGGSVGGGSPPVGGGGGGGGGGGAGSRCCDTGRPLFTDPITGHTVCSCQYDMLGYQRLPALGMYTAAPYPPEAMAAYFPALGPDQPPFYSSGEGWKNSNVHEKTFSRLESAIIRRSPDIVPNQKLNWSQRQGIKRQAVLVPITIPAASAVFGGVNAK
ncbi:hypothetical protein AAG570_012158 [Ranatra chinensis]|uniref:Uncharacterized protein n=1 Tax=Ranatra chinensis TaxID=642074 RepID=A0ABD0YUC4_9HEMI